MAPNASYRGHRNGASLLFSVPSRVWAQPVGHVCWGVGVRRVWLESALRQPAVMAVWPAQSCFLPRGASTWRFTEVLTALLPCQAAQC